MKRFTQILLLSLCVASSSGVWAQIASAPVKPVLNITPEQAEKLVATLTQRNAQLVEVTNALRLAQQQIAAHQTVQTKTDEGLQATVETAVAANRDLVAIGKAILKEYEQMTLGDKTKANEPVTQLYRVKLENRLQQFEDEIAAKRVFKPVPVQ